MPVKRRVDKRRVLADAPFEAWRSALECEFDFFGDLEAWGLVTHEAVRAAARDAWVRHGDQLLAEWRADPRYDGRDPWALLQFGEPRKCR